MRKKVSVVIPVYNVENYLDDCLASIESQTLKDIEIICVDDGSTDRSSDILQKWAERDDRIIILRKKNGGLSSARNAGIIQAEGTYILFLDSDDYLSNADALHELYEKAEKEDVDQLFFNASVVFENDEVKEKNQNYIEYYKRKNQYPKAKSGKELFSDLQENWDFKPNACMQILRKEFLRTNNLFFCEGIVHEDEIFTLECCTLARRAAYLESPFLVRRIRRNSIMTTEQKAKSICGYYSGIRKLSEFAEKYVDPDDKRFFHCYAQRVQVIMDLAARLYLNESDDSKEKIAASMGNKEKIRFGLDMRQYEKNAGLNTRFQQMRKENKKIKEQIQDKEQLIREKEKKIHDLDQEMEILKKQLENSKQREENLRQSSSYKVGRAVTFLPRKIKKTVRRSE